MAAWVASHRKLIAAVAGGAITIGSVIWGPSNPWVQVATVAATALGVYGVPNRSLRGWDR